MNQDNARIFWGALALVVVAAMVGFWTGSRFAGMDRSTGALPEGFLNPDSVAGEIDGASAESPSDPEGMGESEEAEFAYWSQFVDREDLKGSASRLRAMGFPRDVIYSMLYFTVSAEMEQKRIQLEFPDGLEWWEPAPRQNELSRSDITQHILANDALVSDAVGPEWEPSRIELLRAQRKYGDLAWEDFQRLQSIEERRIRLSVGLGDVPDEEKRARLEQFDSDAQDEMDSFLTLAQKEEFNFRNSEGFEVAQRTFSQFELTEGDFRQLAGIYNEAYETIGGRNAYQGSDPLVRRATMAPVEHATRDVLGDERFVAHMLDRDPRFQQVAKMTVSSGRGEEIALAVWEIQNETERMLGTAPLAQTDFSSIRSRLAEAMGSHYIDSYYESGVSSWLRRLEEEYGTLGGGN